MALKLTDFGAIDDGQTDCAAALSAAVAASGGSAGATIEITGGIFRFASWPSITKRVRLLVDAQVKLDSGVSIDWPSNVVLEGIGGYSSFRVLPTDGAAPAILGWGSGPHVMRWVTIDGIKGPGLKITTDAPGGAEPAVNFTVEHCAFNAAANQANARPVWIDSAFQFRFAECQFMASQGVAGAKGVYLSTKPDNVGGYVGYGTFERNWYYYGGAKMSAGGLGIHDVEFKSEVAEVLPQGGAFLDLDGVGNVYRITLDGLAKWDTPAPVYDLAAAAPVFPRQITIRNQWGPPNGSDYASSPSVKPGSVPILDLSLANNQRNEQVFGKLLESCALPIATPTSWTTTGAAVVTQGRLSPTGNSDATLLDTSANSYSKIPLYRADRTLSVGDWFILATWLRSTVPGKYPLLPTIEGLFSAKGLQFNGKNGVFYPHEFVWGYDNPDPDLLSLSDGQWRQLVRPAQVTQALAGPIDLYLTANSSLLGGAPTEFWNTKVFLIPSNSGLLPQQVADLARSMGTW